MCLCTVEEREREREEKCEGENKKRELACSDCIRVAPTWPANPCNKRRLCVERERERGGMQSGSSSSSSFFEGGQQQQNTILLLVVAVKHIRIIFEMRKRNLSEMRENCSQNQKKSSSLTFFLFYSADVPPAFPAQDPPPPRPLTAQHAEIPQKASHFWTGHILQRLWGLSGSWNCGPMEARGCVRAGAKNGKKNWKKKRDKERHSISRSERKRGSFK